MWLILILMLWLVYLFFSNKEGFFVGYNSYIIPDNPIESIYDSETKFIQDEFNKIFDINNVSFDTSGFTLLNNNITFEYNEVFKAAILNFLKQQQQRQFKEKESDASDDLFSSLYIQNNLRDIYFKSDDSVNSKYFIFNCILVNSIHFFSRNIKVKIQVNTRGINVLGILLDTDNYSKFNIPTFDAYYPTHYQIKNTLHLLDPFITSGKDLVLTPTQIANFDNVLIEKSTALQNLNSISSQKIG